MTSTLASSSEAPLFVPKAPEETRTAHFRTRINAQHGLSLASYEDVYTWSTNNLGAFWSAVWDETGVIGEKGKHVLDEDVPIAHNPEWFKEARVNWAENMLKFRDDKVALIEAGEEDY